MIYQTMFNKSYSYKIPWFYFYFEVKSTLRLKLKCWEDFKGAWDKKARVLWLQVLLFVELQYVGLSYQYHWDCTSKILSTIARFHLLRPTLYFPWINRIRRSPVISEYFKAYIWLVIIIARGLNASWWILKYIFILNT